MNIYENMKKIDAPANRAITKMEMAGIPLAKERATKLSEDWQKELKRLEAYVEGEAKKKGIKLKYSEAHATEQEPLIKFLYDETGLGLRCWGETETGKMSTADESLMHYAAIGALHRDDDHPVVYSILKIRSIAKARSTHLGGLIKWADASADGFVHPRFKRNLGNTTRLGAEDPPVQQLPERADPELAKAIKSCIVPRVKPWLGNPDDWDPRIHGFVGAADVSGAEAVIRAGCIADCSISAPYLREGKDIHSKTASILYQVPEGTYKKGSIERDGTGKQSYFLLIFGGSSAALKRVLWKKARMRIDDREASRLHASFFEGYKDLEIQYEKDTEYIFSRGYVEDFYGRRWTVKPHPAIIGYGEDGFGTKCATVDHSKIHKNREAVEDIVRSFDGVRHIYANRPTQTSQATTTLWCIALVAWGEYVPLQTVPYFEERGGILFPEAKGWALHEGLGPGGKPMQVWMMNTVHDSLWFDGAPGYVEPAVKTIVRRFNAVPADFLIRTNMPWRVEVKIGPDFGHLRPYNDVATQFGFEPMPDR